MKTSIMDIMDIQYPDKAMIGSNYDRKDRDSYFTIEPWITEALLKEISHLPIEFVWEPACGAGHMSEVLSKKYVVYSSDIHDYGYEVSVVRDFLETKPFDVHTISDAVITNPPYEKTVCEAFVRKAVSFLETDSRTFLIAMLLRNEWDSAKTRQDLFSNSPFFYKKIVLTSRPRWVEDSKGAPRHNYAWYVWTRFRESKYPVLTYRGKD